jgi:hypothetical protein
MRKEELKARALEIVEVPADFEVFIEDFVEDGNGAGEAVFNWMNEEEDSGITLNLDSEGNLTGLRIDLNPVSVADEPMLLTEKRECAEQFLLEHYPGALKCFTYESSKKLTHSDRFYYKQLVMGLPLDRSGCHIEVDDNGKIVAFTYAGVKPLPVIPADIIPIERLREDVQNKLDFELVITDVSRLILDVEEEGLRLVYELVYGDETYKADEMQPTFKYEREEETPESYRVLPATELKEEHDTNEKIIGITTEMKIIREVDMGDERGVVWRDRDWMVPEQGVKMDDFFKQQTEATVKAFISKATGKVLRFAWFHERNGSLSLNRNECFEIAVTFLQNVTPGFYPYLQQIIRDEDDEPSEKESFVFSIHNGHGVMVRSEIVMVAVNCSTGLVDYYSGPSIDL